VPRRYLPLKVRPEPRTRLEILEEIADLQTRRPGSGEVMKWWIDRRIAELQERMSELHGDHDQH
jgi:hypothetical protein